MKYTADDLHRSIAKLPTVAHELVKYLEDLGIKGYQRDCALCPISEFINKECLADREVMMCKTNRGVLEVRFGYTSHRQTLRTKLPQHISEFIDNFDNGMYPTLVRGDVKIQ